MDYIINIDQIYVHTPALIHHISLVVRVAISAFGEYFCRIRNHVITKHYHQLMPLSLATSGFRESVKSNMAKVSQLFMDGVEERNYS
ncbi:hypothetical protein T12_15359 [Trichinella patagoniensis]|uniref:Uncharacterized protein n=1 Tax=Trichinella patagoniensis TaxID=990121 RepID=A0A0V0Z4J2_9BILA|nr:hypothetical protein T12_15359 [Trichinella patagoniensis]